MRRALITLGVFLGVLVAHGPSARCEEVEEDGPKKITPEESKPQPPPTADDVSAAEANEFETLSALKQELDYFQKGAISFSKDVSEAIRVQYELQRERLQSQYDERITKLEAGERKRREEAIARFELFIERYPDDPAYTPDAMYRLAELYFERGSDEFLEKARTYEKLLVAFEQGKSTEEPVYPSPSYLPTIALHESLISRFPEYRFADGARYLLGYCHGEMGQIELSLASYHALVEKHPESKFVPEAWTRIGEIYFEGTDRATLLKSIAAYREVLAHPDSPYYDKALYKIAWAYYRIDDFDPAVASFVQLVDYADTRKAETGVTGSELRAEAIQYIAISLADETWGGMSRAKVVLAKIDEKPYASEIWKRYGEILYDQTRYDLAIQVLAFNLEKYPTAKTNPESHAKLVSAYKQLRDFNGSSAALQKMVASYVPGTPWYEANKSDPQVLEKVETLTETLLYGDAIFHHQQAQAYKKANKLTEAQISYGSAATAYATYLARFPATKNAYDFQFFLGECLYYTGQYEAAAAQYDRVRDSTVDNRHIEAAALSSVLAYEKQVEALEQQKKIPEYPLMTAADRKGAAPAAKDLTPNRQRLLDASDRFLVLLPDSDRAPAIAYRAGELVYRHDRFPEARTRFEGIISKYPANEVARYASNLIIETYLADQDWKNVEKESQRLIDVARKVESKDPSQEALVASLKVFKVGAQFKQAEKYDADGQFEEAADTYVRLVDENPENEFADKSLFNAAIAYEKARRFDTASQTYKRLYTNYPTSELAPRALFRVGVNAEKGFDFPAAVEAYSILVQRYPSSENRADALYNAAVVQENMQQYGTAASSYRTYAETFPKRDDSGAVYFRAALVYEKMEAWPKMIDTLKDFVARYKGVTSQRERLVEAHEKMGDAYKALENERGALAAYRECVSEFNRMRLPVSGPAGGYAGNCAFGIAESIFRTYDQVKIEGTGRKQVEALQTKAKLQRQVEDAYTEVFRYKRAETTLAASYRIGFSYERFAESLFSAPIPKEFEAQPELADEYKAQLEDRAAVLERKAESAYRKAYTEARKSRVTNEWTQRTLEGLNKYAPKEFPVQKQGLAAMQMNTVSGETFDMGAGKESAPEPVPAPKPASEGGIQAPTTNGSASKGMTNKGSP
jgi:cellulose synthase operon protein C